MIGKTNRGSILAKSASGDTIAQTGPARLSLALLEPTIVTSTGSATHATLASTRYKEARKNVTNVLVATAAMKPQAALLLARKEPSPPVAQLQANAYRATTALE